jgi:multiple sugar transport system permease protein
MERESTVPTNSKTVQLDRVIAIVVVIFFAFVTLFPLYWALRTALSTQRELLSAPVSLLPVGFTWSSFQQALGMVSKEEAIAAGGSGRVFEFWKYLGNTTLIATTIAIGQVFFSAMAAFAFSRLRWKGRDFMFALFLAAMMVPGIVMLIPNYVLIYELGWMNTYQAVIVPGLFFSPYAIFFLRQFFMGINRELEEAARLDGATHWQVFTRHVIPMTQGPILTIGIISFITSWNDYLWPFLVARNESVRPLTVALSIFRSQTPQGSPDWPGMMAGTILASIPIIVIYLVLGRRIADSLQFTGIK